MTLRQAADSVVNAFQEALLMVFGAVQGAGFLLVMLVLGWLAYQLIDVTPAHARDDGRYKDEPLHAWFDQLASGKGLCCSFADGFSVTDVDWDTKEICDGNLPSGGSETTSRSAASSNTGSD